MAIESKAAEPTADCRRDNETLIRSVPIFSGLSAETLNFIMQQSEQVNYPAGSYFFREGDSGDRIYVLRTGTALVERTWQGRQIVLARIKPGDCFGEMSLIDLQRRFASIQAETDCEAIVVPFGVLTHLCQSDLQQYTMLMMNLGREVSRRLRIAGERLFRYEQEMGRQWFDEQLTGDA